MVIYEEGTNSQPDGSTLSQGYLSRAVNIPEEAFSKDSRWK
jgi:hypothetical protein